MLRLMKLYRNKPSTRDQYDYVLMWATIVDDDLSPKSAFMVDNDVFQIGSSASNKNHPISMVVSNNGLIYVIARKDGRIYLWKVCELFLDLGHNTVGVTDNTHTTDISSLLKTLTSDYNLFSQETSAYFDGFPPLSSAGNSVSPSTVIIDYIESADNYYGIRFKYLNFDAFRGNESMHTDFANTLLSTLSDMYAQQDIALLNYNTTEGTIFEGDTNTMIVKIPTNNLLKPCVVKGTEIVVMNNDKAELKNVEHVKVGDMVANQDGKPVKVVHHSRDIIKTNDWNTPHRIPVNYFGPKQPYKNLYISGDHGIRYGSKKLYAYKMRNAFKRIPVGTEVEYHHLKLANIEDFYLANGLLVESLR